MPKTKSFAGKYTLERILLENENAQMLKEWTYKSGKTRPLAIIIIASCASISQHKLEANRKHYFCYKTIHLFDTQVALCSPVKICQPTKIRELIYEMNVNHVFTSLSIITKVISAIAIALQPSIASCITFSKMSIGSLESIYSQYQKKLVQIKLN